LNSTGISAEPVALQNTLFIIFKRPHNKIGMKVEEVALAAIVEAG